MQYFFNTFCKELYTYTCSITKKLSFFWLKFLYCNPHFDNKSYKAFLVRSVARSNLYAQQSKWLLNSISQIWSLSDLSQKLLMKIDQSINMALVNGGYFHYTNMEEIPKKCSSLTVLVRV